MKSVNGGGHDPCPECHGTGEVPVSEDDVARVESLVQDRPQLNTAMRLRRRRYHNGDGGDQREPLVVDSEVRGR